MEGYQKMAESNTNTNSEGSAWFWKIFGSTILGMITLLLVTIFANLRNEQSDNKHELMNQIDSVRSDIRFDRESFNLFKERLVALEQAKEKIQEIIQSLNSVSESLNSQKEKIASLETAIMNGKENNKLLQEEIKDLQKQIQDIREKIAGLNSIDVKKPATEVQ